MNQSWNKNWTLLWYVWDAEKISNQGLIILMDIIFSQAIQIKLKNEQILPKLSQW